MNETNELNWHPDNDDPAYDAGVAFAQRCPSTPVAFRRVVRQSFWNGVKWAREQRSLPISGRVLEDGKIEWREEGP